MRDKMLGRWMFRLAVTIGAGSVALGLPAVAAHANEASYSGLVAIPGAVEVVSGTALMTVQPEHVYFTDDFGWG